VRILLVEDDAESANYVLQGLQEAGHNLVIARDGRDGLRELPRLVLLERHGDVFHGRDVVGFLHSYLHETESATRSDLKDALGRVSHDPRARLSSEPHGEGAL